MIIRLGYSYFEVNESSVDDINKFICGLAKMRHVDNVTDKVRGGAYKRAFYYQDNHTLEIIDDQFIARGYDSAKQYLNNTYGEYNENE